jgi:pimeloyl-ACP methyl ester carboxylesterase
MNDLSNYLEPGGRRTELVVLVHGLGNASDRLADVRAVLRSARPDADLFAPKLGYADSLFCTDKAEAIVAALVAHIDAFDAARGGEGYATITLVGHSLGAVLARKIAIVAFGEQKAAGDDVPAPFEPEFEQYRQQPRVWARRINRLVLLAGMNRGWSAASTTDWLTGVWLRLGEFVGETLGGALTIFAIRRGAARSSCAP